METSAVPLLAEKQHSGYNNCFVLGGKVEKAGQDGKKHFAKIRAYIDEYDKVQWLSKDTPFYHSLTHLTYDEANTALLTYRKKHAAPWGRVSLWLEHAKYNDLYIFVKDFDKIDGKIDTESPYFKGALQIANKVTRSQGGGYHMFYGIDREKAEPLFDSINLLASRTAKSFIKKTGNITLDGRNKVDFFCDTPSFIYEWEEWDNNVELTDRTQELYELIKANFELTRPFDFGTNFVGDADNGFTCIEEMSEEMLLDEMTTEQQLVFADLKNLSCECSAAEWFSIGINIWHVFGDELGGSVFQWWSKPGHSYNGPGCATTWEHIGNRGIMGATRLNNSRWRSILGLDINFSDEYETPRQAEIQQQLKELGERIQVERQTNMPADNSTLPLPLADFEATTAEPLTFRGLPIQWKHENVSADNALDEEEQSGNARHRILWGAAKYKRDDFFRAIWGADYKKIREKAIFKGAAADNVLRLTTGQRTALEYDALYHRHIDKLVFVDEQDEKELFAFFTSDDCSTAKETLRRLNFVDGAKKVATFGAGRQQTGAAEFTWCYTKEPVKGGNRYKGVALDWSLWASGIEQAYNNYLNDKNAKLWDKVRPAMYCQRQGYEVCRMTYSTEDYQ